MSVYDAAPDSGRRVPLESVRHSRVFCEEGKFAGWPANGGMWQWGDELLFGFTLAEHFDRPSGHTYDKDTARHMFARSMDGGETWSIEDVLSAGKTGNAHDHSLGECAAPPRKCPGGVDFLHTDFALLFHRMNNSNGPSHFYWSHDRGRSWDGPFAFPNLDTAGIATRTDYHVEGSGEMLAFLTAAKSNGLEGRVLCARTSDGGRSWRRVSWLGAEPAPERGHFRIMPASARLSAESFLAAVRCSLGDAKGIEIYRSDDNAQTWRQMDAPALGNLPGQTGDPVHNPPAMARLRDGRLCLAYGVRVAPARMVVRLSEDEGRTWSDEAIVRGNDGACFDMGYPRLAQRPDGKVVLVYYYNHALLDGAPYRYIAQTVFDPECL